MLLCLPLPGPQQYKSHYTLKFLLSILSNGATYFISEAYGGAINDRDLTKASGILDIIGNGEDCMVDKGFMIRDLLLAVGSVLYVPPKMRKNRGHQPTQEEDRTSSVGRLRIFVENGVGRIKDFEILKRPLRISNIHNIGQMVYVLGMLTNIHAPYISGTESA